MAFQAAASEQAVVRLGLLLMGENDIRGCVCDLATISPFENSRGTARLKPDELQKHLLIKQDFQPYHTQVKSMPL